MEFKKEIVSVSVCMITYNHEKFISEAINSVLIQKCNFPIEIVIGEDNSTDLTRAICEDYAKKYPNLIKLLHSNINLGITSNFNRTLKACGGKYIALCEGDDYWIDPFKLQKQVDLLEQNHDYHLIHTNGYILNNKKLIPWHEWDEIEGNVKQTFFYGPSARTCSVLFRSNLLGKYLKLFENSNIKIIGDWPLFAFYSTQGKFGYIKERMVVYRSNPKSISSSKHNNCFHLYSLDVIEVKRFLRDIVFKGELDELYSEGALLIDKYHILLKDAFDTWNYKKAKLYAKNKELAYKSRYLIFFTSNYLTFIIGCTLKWVKKNLNLSV